MPFHTTNVMEIKTFYSKMNKFGMLIAVLALIGLSILTYNSYTIAVKDHQECTLVRDDVGSCTVIGHVPLESYIGIFALLIVICVGVYTVYYSRNASKSMEHSNENISENVKNLSDEEKKLYEIIKSKEGAAFQTDLVKETGFSKVKVSRLIDKMELKGIVERRRRGMSNVVVLK